MIARQINIDIVILLVLHFHMYSRSTFEHSVLALPVSHTSNPSRAQENALRIDHLCSHATLLRPDRPFRGPFLPLSSFSATLTSNSPNSAKSAPVSPLA